MGFFQESQTYLPPYNPDRSKLVRPVLSPRGYVDQCFGFRHLAIQRNLSKVLQYRKKREEHLVPEEQILNDRRK